MVRRGGSFSPFLGRPLGRPDLSNMIKSLQQIHTQLPRWADQWLDTIVILTQIAAVTLVAWLLMRLVRHLTKRMAAKYGLPPLVVLLPRRAINIAIGAGAFFLSLQRLGVSGPVLWTAFTGFVTVGAVAFFAAWSVLSNLFCTLLIFVTGAFRHGDIVELLESGDKPGYKGHVVDINLVYTTLQDATPDSGGALLQIPNSLFFQRALRRWR